LITRNRRSSVETVLARHGLSISVLITRQDAPAKPDPAPLQLACRKLNVPAARAWMVGDGQYDIEAGVATPMFTVWISYGRRRDFAAEPDWTVTDLYQLMRNMELAECES